MMDVGCNDTLKAMYAIMTATMAGLQLVCGSDFARNHSPLQISIFIPPSCLALLISCCIPRILISSGASGFACVHTLQ